MGSKAPKTPDIAPASPPPPSEKDVYAQAQQVTQDRLRLRSSEADSMKGKSYLG